MDEGHAPGDCKLAPLVEAFGEVVHDEDELHGGLERVLRLVPMLAHIFEVI